MMNKLIALFLKKKVLHRFEKVAVFNLTKDEQTIVMAKVDTGADRSSLDEKVAEKLGLLENNNIVAIKKYRSGLGHQERKIVNVTFILKGKKITSQVSITDRTGLNYSMLIGIKDIKGFLVDPNRN